MKTKFSYAILCCLLLLLTISCTPKQEKIEKCVNIYMQKMAEDVNVKYEPLYFSDFDTCYSSIFTDTAYVLKKAVYELDNLNHEHELILSEINTQTETLQNIYTYAFLYDYAQLKRLKLKFNNDFKKTKSKLEQNIDTTLYYMNIVREINDTIKQDNIGWQIQHTFVYDKDTLSLLFNVNNKDSVLLIGDIESFLKENEYFKIAISEEEIYQEYINLLIKEKEMLDIEI